jgi:hypothetical protein
VNLRYDRQVIVNPDLPGVERQPALSQAAARAAIFAGVKPAALVNRETAKSKAPSVGPQRAASKPLQKARWHKRWAPAKHATVKPAAHAAAPSIPKSQHTPQKPSPAVAKGRGTP